MGLVRRSSLFEAPAVPFWSDHDCCCHDYDLAFTNDRTSTRWAYLTGSGGRHRVGDRVGDDCRQSGGSRDWTVRWLFGHCNDGWNVREIESFPRVPPTKMSRID